MTLRFHLLTVGVLQILLALAHVAFPRFFAWREELARLSLLNRQIFYVHNFFICLVLVLFGSLNLACADELLATGRLNRAILAGITLFWSVRLLFQFFVYSPHLWRGHRFNTVMHCLATLVWLYFAGTHGWALARQFGYGTVP